MSYDRVARHVFVRLLIICGAGYISGLERVTLDLVHSLRARHELHCLSTTWGDGEVFRTIKAMGVPCERLPLGFISKSLSPAALWMTVDQAVQLPRLWIGYARLLARINPDAVLATNFHHAILLGAFPGRRTWFHVHDAWPLTSFHGAVARWLSRRYAGLIAVSDFIRGRLIDLGVPGESVFRVHNGVGMPDEMAIGQRASVAGPVRVGIVGQVGPWKGHEDLFAAMVGLRKRWPACDWRLRVYGAGTDGFVSSLKSLAVRGGIGGRVEWMGYCKDQASIYRGLDICVVPSRFDEPFGLVAAEAGAWGLPVVATRRGGLPEIVQDGVSGLLVEAYRPDQLSEAIHRLICDRNLCLRIGRAGRRMVSGRFGIERMVSDIEALLCERKMA